VDRRREAEEGSNGHPHSRLRHMVDSTRVSWWMLDVSFDCIQTPRQLGGKAEPGESLTPSTSVFVQLPRLQDNFAPLPQGRTPRPKRRPSRERCFEARRPDWMKKSRFCTRPGPAIVSRLLCFMWLQSGWRFHLDTDTSLRLNREGSG
jgi:hypothetical protein